MVFFAVGIGALLWVFRRMILLSRRDSSKDADKPQQNRLLKARELVAEVEDRNWLTKYRRAVKIQRTSHLDREQRHMLGDLTAHQQARGRK